MTGTSFFRSQSRHLVLFMLAGLSLVTAITGSLPADDLAERVRTLHRRHSVDPDHAGILVTEYPSGDTVFRQQASTPFIPASNVKILTALAALETLGASHRFRTELYVDDPDPTDASIRHLYVRGSGDPTISKRFHKKRTTVFRRWARMLRSKGVRTIRGDLVLDESRYERVHYHPTWDRYKHTFWYTAPVSALNFNDNCVYVRVLPDKPGRKAAVTVRPPGSPIRILNHAKTVPASSRAHIQFKRIKHTWDVRVEGRIRPGTARPEWITVPDPGRFFGTVLESVLRKSGVDIRGRVRRGNVPSSLLEEPLRVYQTPLPEVIRVMLEESQNLYAETVFKQIGYAARGKGSWSNGVTAIRHWLSKRSIPADGLRILDGSGLSRKNRLTPAAIVHVLRRWLKQRKHRSHVRLLPVSGRSGTLDDRLSEPPYRGAIAAKTGTLDGVTALSGVAGLDRLSETGGRVMLFSILVNQPGRSSARGRQFTDGVARAVLDLLRAERR